MTVSCYGALEIVGVIIIIIIILRLQDKNGRARQIASAVSNLCTDFKS